MSSHAEISLSSLESIKDNLESAKTYIWQVLNLEYDDIMKNRGMTVIKSIDSDIKIIDECLEKPLHDGYHE